MINWIELTRENWEDVMWSNADIIDCPIGYERTNGDSSPKFVFLNEDGEIVRICSRHDKKIFDCQGRSREITHYALREAYEGLLPKSKKVNIAPAG